MNLNRYYLSNFRRLEDVEVHLSQHETIFVGPNNSGKTSAATVFRLFVSQTRDFKIHDFSAPLIKEIDEYENLEDKSIGQLPSIEMDLWFSINPDTEYGRVANFLPSLSAEYSEVGTRLSFSVDDAEELLAAYKTACSQKEKEGAKKKTLSEFLSEEGHLKKFFSLKYYKLESLATPFSKEKVKAHSVEKEIGRTTLNSLVRADFVDAQRNIDDVETSRSNRLSTALGDFYKFNLEQSENDVEALSVIDKSNENLSSHYEKQFKGLIEIISDLGFPSSNDRVIKILSTLKPEAALRGNTTLIYAEKESDHQLPEAYNGLGFKNLIYMAVQISHYQRRWLAMDKNRPLSHLLFIEEPEVHLHAQVQQAFIRQIRKITEKIAKSHGDGKDLPQLIISTHSSHLLDESDFTAIRYFQRVKSKSSKDVKSPRRTATKVLNLANFDPEKKDPENIMFLKKYIKLTHCDLFFSDAAVLVEGTVERLLFPRFIEENAPDLKATYLTILEVGGAYAHRLIPLLNFIGLPSLIITDIDSIDPTKNRAACRADTPNATTSNKTITTFVKLEKIVDLLEVKSESKVQSDNGAIKRIAYQCAVSLPAYGADKKMIPRTFEEAFVYENLAAIREGKLDVLFNLPKELNFENDYTSVFEAIKTDGYKKVEFALNQIQTEEKWITPSYIVEGLTWLKNNAFPDIIENAKSVTK